MMDRRACRQILLAGSAALWSAGALAAPPSAAASPSAASAPAATPAAPAPLPVLAPAPSKAEAAAALGRGLQAIAAHDDAAALPLLETVLASDPESLRAASEYRQAAIRLAAYDRALGFFEALAQAHPDSANAELNWGYAYVDKIPSEGAISRVILADSALRHFTRSLEIRKTWIGLYTRGNSYLFWPKVFNRVPLAVADLEEAVAMSKSQPKRRVYARAWVALGDAYWQSDQRERARATWQEGLRLFPGDQRLLTRLGKSDEEIAAYLYEQLDPSLRVDTNLADLWADE